MLPLITWRQSADLEVVLEEEFSSQVEILQTFRFCGIQGKISTIVWLSLVIPSECYVTNIEPEGYLSVTRQS
jgi:hypothetical protein